MGQSIRWVGHRERRDTHGAREGGRCDAARSPEGNVASPRGSVPGIGYQAGRRGDARGRRRRTAEERDRYGPPYAEIGSPRMRRCRDALWYLQRSALTRDVSIRMLSLSKKQRGKEKKNGREKRERERKRARVMERRRSSKPSFALHACAPPNITRVLRTQRVL